MEIHATITVNVYFSSGVDQLKTLIQQLGANMANELADLQREVTENNDVIDSAVTLIQGIKAKLDEAIASNNPAALAALSTALDTQSKKLADAVAANTPSGGNTP